MNMIGKGKGDITAQVGKTLKAQEEETHLFLGYRVVGTCLGVPPEETPKILVEILVSPPFEDYAQGWFQIWPDYYVGTTSFDQ
jgi:hypothetical protein